MAKAINRREFLKVTAVAGPVAQAGATSLASSEEAQVVELPKPQMEGGKPLLELLKSRKSVREFNEKKIPLPVLSNLLWAGFGVNRPDGKRTAPSARNWQETDIYVASPDGLYLYDAKPHVLVRVRSEDIRAATGTQEYVKTAAVNLIYVADYAKAPNSPTQEKDMWSPCNTGLIAENVFLFCASEGLNTVIRGLIDKPALSKVMGLRPDQKIILCQSIGYPPG